MPRKGSIMPATLDDELRLAAAIARPALLTLAVEYGERVARSDRWREEYMDRVDLELDRAIDRARDLAHNPLHAASV